MAAAQVFGSRQHSLSSRRGALALTLVLAVTLGISTPLVGSPGQENHPVKDVLKAFDNLTHHGEWLGFHNGDVGSPVRDDYDSTHHIQGIVRSPRTGTPYMFACAAGSWSGDVSDADLMVIEMGSRGGTGERLRSNRLLKDTETSCTLPPLTDQVVRSIQFPDYRHPGGMQMVGNILAVPLEQPDTDWQWCHGGDNDRGSCLAHCPDGVCTQFCYDGSNHGNECSVDSECPDGECKALCQGGSNHGQSCDCPGGGICSDTCYRGSNDGEPCDDDDDCPDGACVGLPGGRVLFYNMSDPLNPTLIHTLNIHDSDVPDSLFCGGGSNGGNPCESDLDCPGGGKCKILAEAGFAGVTQLPDGHFLVMVGMKAGKYVGFWRSNYTSFLDPGFKFEFHDSWHPKELVGDKFCFAGSNEGGVCDSNDDCPDSGCILEEWPVGTTAAQNFSLINQEDGRLFMIAGRNMNPMTPLVPGADLIVPYEITGFEPGQKIEIRQRRRWRPVSFYNDSSLVELAADFIPIPQICAALPTAEAMNGNLLAGGSAYVSPSGELLFYAVNHYNDGPHGPGEDPIVRFSELRHVNVVEDPQPFRLAASAGGPYVVDEGGTIVLDGNLSRAHAIGPWVQLFDDKDFGGQSVMLDYADRVLDDYDDFSKLDGEPVINDCVDLAALADVTEAGKQVYDTAKSLIAGDFYNEACLGILTESGCWEVVPGWVIDAACTGACDVTYAACDLVCNGVCLAPFTCCSCCRNDCSYSQTVCYGLCGMIWDPGVEAILVAVPNFTSPAWDILSALNDVLILADPLIASIFDDYCGKELPVDIWTPPTPPNPLDAFDSVNWPWNGDPWAFFASFPDFARDLRDALDDLVTYTEDFLDYLEDLIVSLEGFNNRASSVRWSAPVGVDIVLHDQAGYNGGQLILRGNGGVQSYSTLNGLDMTDGLDADNRIRSMEFSGAYSAPTLVSHAWSIIDPDPPEPFILHSAATSTPVFDASLGDGPEAAEVELVVTDSLGGVASATAIIDILNVAPEVMIEGIEDQTGTNIFDGVPVLLEALEYVLVGSHTDAGIPDTHIADVQWGDGSANTSGEDIFDFADSLGGVTGTVRVPHTYASKGDYSIALTVEDDDGGSTTVIQPVQVVDAIGAIELCVERLGILMDDNSLGSEVRHALRKAVSMLQGNGGGSARNGAIDLLEKGNLNAALQKILQAMTYLATVLESDASLIDSLKPVQQLMALAAKCVAVKAIAEAGVKTLSHHGKSRPTLAGRYLARGDERLAAGDYVGAVEYYQRAQRVVQGGS